MRQEWKHFAQIPQQPGTQITNTQVLMNGWLISKDGTVFLPQKPTYKAYGSFYTDWTLPRPGDYTLWLEYQPAVAQNEELSAAELMQRRASYNLPREIAYWDFKAVGANLPDLKTDTDDSVHPSNGMALKTYNDRGERVKDDVTIQPYFCASRTKIAHSVGFTIGRPRPSKTPKSWRLRPTAARCCTKSAPRRR